MAGVPSFRETQQDEAEKLIQYTRQLYDLKRYADAESKSRQVLARDPQNWTGHYYLAAALIVQADQKPEKNKEAMREAQKAVALRPDAEASYFLLGWASLANRKPDDALIAVHQGMRINPQDSFGYLLAAQAQLFKREWEKALQAAETGLSFEPEDVSLLNARAEALIMLNRQPDAQAAVEAALRADPASSRAHLNRGWLAMYTGKPPDALVHFREALRLDPTSEAARSGLLQALNARNPLYRLMMRYYLWTRRLTHAELWGLWGLLSGFNTMTRMATRLFPPLIIITLPYFILYGLFSFFSWVGDGFFNLLLRLSPTGRLILDNDERASATGCGFTAGLFLINALALVAALIWHPGDFRLLWIFLVGAVISVGMMMPISGIFKVDPSFRNRRAFLIALAVIMGVNAACGWGGAFSMAPWHAIPIGLFLLGWLVYPWAALVIMSVKE